MAASRRTELHDSVLAIMWYEQSGEAVLIFQHLYVHESKGRPGVNVGVGWFQRAELVIHDASVADFIRAWPFEIYDGEAVVDGTAYSNGFPLPLRCRESFKIVLEGSDDEQNLRRIEIEGSGAVLTFVGEPGTPETFPGEPLPDDA